MQQRMKRLTILLISGLFAFQAYSYNLRDTTELKPKAVYGKEARVIAYILDNNHYRKITLNDSLSSVILDEYIKTLDVNKMYFTVDDLKSFEKYRYMIDDLTKAENVDPAYDIFKVFKKR